MQHDRLAFRRGGFRPTAFFKDRTRGLHRAIDVFNIAFGDLGQNLAVARADAIKRFTRCRIDINAIDKGLVADRQAGGLCSKLFEIQLVCHRKSS